MWIKTADAMYNFDSLDMVWVEGNETGTGCRTCARDWNDNMVVLSWTRDVRGLIKNALLDGANYVEVN